MPSERAQRKTEANTIAPTNAKPADEGGLIPVYGQRHPLAVPYAGSLRWASSFRSGQHPAAKGEQERTDEKHCAVDEHGRNSVRTKANAAIRDVCKTC